MIFELPDGVIALDSVQLNPVFAGFTIDKRGIWYFGIQRVDNSMSGACILRWIERDAKATLINQTGVNVRPTVAGGIPAPKVYSFIPIPNRGRFTRIEYTEIATTVDTEYFVFFPHIRK